MKKMMMMIAVALTAVVTQAASVNWQVLNVRVPTEGAGLTISSTGNAKFTVANAASSLVMKLYLVPTSGDPVDLGVSTSTLTADGTKGSAELWDQDAAVAKRTTYGNNVTLRLASVYTTAEGTYTLNMDLTKSLENVEAALVSYSFNQNGQTWTFTPVPEPCAVALLVLGVAAFGLKRRIAK